MTAPRVQRVQRVQACADPGGSVGAFLCQAGQVLRAAAIESPRIEARRLLAHALGCREEQLLRDPRAMVPAEAAAAFGALLRRRATREPMAYVLGRTGFWTLELEVSPATLIPRADSEAVVEAALAAYGDRDRPGRVLDLGTGTGALLLAVLSECPATWGLGVDISAKAARIAAGNAATNGLSGRAQFIVGDWDAAVVGGFDLVVSNPPYIASGDIPGLMPEVSGHEPRLALDGGLDGLDAYRRLFGTLAARLRPGGRAVLEIGRGQGSAVSAIAEGYGLEGLEVACDLGGVDRALVFGLDPARRAGKKAFGAQGWPG